MLKNPQLKRSWRKPRQYRLTLEDFLDFLGFLAHSLEGFFQTKNANLLQFYISQYLLNVMLHEDLSSSPTCIQRSLLHLLDVPFSPATQVWLPFMSQTVLNLTERKTNGPDLSSYFYSF